MKLEIKNKNNPENIEKSNLLNNSGVWFHTIDCEGRLLFMNQFAEAFCGYSNLDFQGNLNFWEKVFVSEEAGLRMLNIFRASIGRARNIKSKISRIKTRSGEIKKLLWSLTVNTDSQGKATGASIIGFDHTTISCNISPNNPDHERYRHIFRNAPIGFFRSMPEGKFLEVNNALAKLLGFETPEEVLYSINNIGEDVYVDADFRTEIISEAINSGKVKSFETIFRDRYNHTFDVRINVSARFDEEISSHILEGTIEDITARKTAERELHKNLIKYSTLFEKSPISVWEVDYSKVKIELDKIKEEVDDLHDFFNSNPGALKRIRQQVNIIDINAATLELFEVNSKEEFFENQKRQAPQLLSDMEFESMQALAEGKMSFEHETIFTTVHSGNKNIIVRWVVAPETSVPYSRVLVSLIDITEQKLEQIALEKSKNELSSLISSMDDLVFILDKDGTYLYIAPTRPELLISSANNLLGKNMGDFLDQDTFIKFRDTIKESLEEQKTKSMNYPLSINGADFWFEAKVSPLTADSAIVVARNVTERINTEKANRVMLNVSKAVSTTDKIDELFELIRLEITRLIDTKNFFIALYDAENLTLSLPFFQDEKDHFDQIPTEKTLSSLVLNQKKSLLLRHAEIMNLTKQGKIDVHGTVAKVWLGTPLMAEGEVLGLMVVQNYENEDAIREEHKHLLEMISPQISLSIKSKQSEQLLKESEKQLRESNQTKDRFFNIIAHDLKNPFNAIIGFSSLLTEEWNEFDDDDKISMISSIKTSSEGAYELLMNLLEWSRLHVGKIAFEPEFIDYASLIRINFSLLKSNSDKKNIKLISDGLCDKMIWADPNMIKTVIRNLITNAIKFTPDGGLISVECYKNPDMSGMMNLSIKDSGVGIPEDDIKNLFSLTDAHSTRGTGGETGTGLGLALCREFIEKNNGKIWAESEPGKGSTFHIAVPVRPN